MQSGHEPRWKARLTEKLNAQKEKKEAARERIETAREKAGENAQKWDLEFVKTLGLVNIAGLAGSITFAAKDDSFPRIVPVSFGIGLGMVVLMIWMLGLVQVYKTIKFGALLRDFDSGKPYDRYMQVRTFGLGVFVVGIPGLAALIAFTYGAVTFFGWLVSSKVIAAPLNL